jgi:hypothetical protein
MLRMLIHPTSDRDHNKRKWVQIALIGESYHPNTRQSSTKRFNEIEFLNTTPSAG